MVRAAVRSVLFAIVTIAIWTVARPAHAMPAPFCDDRGATAMAPAPTLEAPDTAVRRARLPATCSGEERLTGAAVTPGHGGSLPDVSHAEPALVTPTITLAAPAAEWLEAPLSATPIAEGVICLLERPPRA